MNMHFRAMSEDMRTMKEKIKNTDIIVQSMPLIVTEAQSMDQSVDAINQDIAVLAQRMNAMKDKIGLVSTNSNCAWHKIQCQLDVRAGLFYLAVSNSLTCEAFQRSHCSRQVQVSQSFPLCVAAIIDFVLLVIFHIQQTGFKQRRSEGAQVVFIIIYGDGQRFAE